MRHFVILFNGGEGTSPLVRLLNNFDQISIVHQINNSGWEPFDNHNCGQMPVQSLKQCLELIFNNESLDMESLNRIYTKTATKPLENINKNGSVGYKMRFNSPYNIKMPLWNSFVHKIFNRFQSSHDFKKSMFSLLERNGVVVFMAVRQDVFRWALSTYHGGLLQFKIANKTVDKEDLGKTHVDCEKLEEIISRKEEAHSNKRKLMDQFERAGIEVHPLRYEDFLKDKAKYFQRICETLEMTISREGINSALSSGAFFEKVHSDQISEFVINHKEVMKRFSNRFCSW